MEMTHYSFPSINQFRAAIHTVRERAEYHKTDVPTLGFRGTVKLHGTNAGVVVNRDGSVYAQSRSNVITIEDDNAGFARFVDTNKSRFLDLGQYLLSKQPDEQTVVIYGEWIGKGIQKKVAISSLEKRFVVFAVRFPRDEDAHSIWLSPGELSGLQWSWDDSINTIHNFPAWTVMIDFSKPETAQSTLVELTNQVEAQCPVGKAYGVDGIGEGVVWVCEGGHVPFRTSDLIFKVKGALHSDTKTKNLAAIDVEKVAAIGELADNLTTDHRLEKGVDHVRQEFPGKHLDKTMIPNFLKWVGQDIVKEESDTIIESGFEPREVTKAANRLARDWFVALVDAEEKERLGV